MAEFWFGVLATTLIVFSVLDGFDFGAGALTLYLGKTEGERRAVISAIGPFWDGNEVWLIASGGVLFLAFPSVLAAAFPAFYLALFLVLWCLILRGIAMEVRSHVTDSMWRSFWDVVLTIGSGLLALLFGVALGNVVRGMPIGNAETFALAFFTDFLPSGNVGLLDWYTVSVGILSLVALLAHGAAFLTYRTEGSLRLRARRLERRLWMAGGVLFVVVTIETTFVRPELFDALLSRPLAWAFTALALGGIVGGMRAFAKEHDRLTFVASSAVLAGLLGATATALFPTMLHSTIDPARSVTAEQALSAPYGLGVAVVWWPIAFALAVTYFAFAFRANQEKIRSEPEREPEPH
jgi:cytochrome d ubiquinol oxidase subunit II